jgi:pilus assembly protein CpaE
MYPLPIVLLGIDEELLPGLQKELWGASAQVESEFKSAYMAIDCLRHYKNQQRLLIVQTGPELQPEAIERLAATFRGWPILALLPAASGDDFLRVNRAGAVQVLALPLDPADFQRALGVIGSQFDRASLDRHVFAVASAAGGSGATTIAANLAYELAEQLGRPTILAELTQRMGALASMFDLTPRVTLAHLIREIHRVDDYLVEKTLVPFTDKLRILSGPDELSSPRSAEPGDLVKIVECLRTLADRTVLDLPGTFDELETEVLRASDKVIVVGAQSVRSLKSLRLVCESLPEERQVHSLWIVLNRYNPALKGFTCDDVKDMLGVARVMGVADDAPAVQLSVNRSRPLRMVAPGTPILADLGALIDDLMGLDRREARKNGRGLFGRMLHALTR